MGSGHLFLRALGDLSPALVTAELGVWFDQGRRIAGLGRFLSASPSRAARVGSPIQKTSAPLLALELRWPFRPLAESHGRGRPLIVALNGTGETFNNSQLAGVRDARELNLRGSSSPRRLFR